MAQFRIRDFVVDPGRNVIITLAGAEIHLEPKVMEVLCVLARHPGEPVSRDLLIEQVWGVEHGADEGPTRAISKLRKVFSDANNESRYIETIPKRGYRLIAPVTVIRAGRRQPDGPDGQNGSDDVLQARGSKGEPPIHPATTASTTQAISESATRPTFFRIGLTAGFVLIALSGVIIALFINSNPASREANRFPDNRVEMRKFRVIGNDSVDTAVTVFAESLSANISAVLAANNIAVMTPDTAERGGTSGLHLSGDIEQERDQLLVRVKLHNNKSGAQIWTHVHKRGAKEASDFREQVSIHTARVLDCAFGIRSETLNLSEKTFQLYLRFCAAANAQGTGGDLAAYSKQILNSDPGNPKAMAVHAIILATRGAWHWRRKAAVREQKANKARAQSLAKQALEIDPDEPIAHAALAWSIQTVDNAAQVERHLLQTLSDKRIDGAGGLAGRVARLLSRARCDGRGNARAVA